MLWLEWEGGQLPIGWDAGPAATIPNLFSTSWKVYTGVNTGNGMTVVSPFRIISLLFKLQERCARTSYLVVQSLNQEWNY